MSAKAPREVAVPVETLSDEGLGVGRAGERRVRIRNALPGETVRARVLKRRRGEWWAEAFDIDEPAANRVDAPCANFPRCGGCSMQHLDYPAQLALKQTRLLDGLAAVGVSPRQVAAPTPGPRFHYRTKARLGVRVVGGQVLAGFRESFSNRVGRMDACLTLTPELAALIRPLKSLIARLSRPERIPQVELAAGDRCQAVILRHLEPLTERDELLAAEFAASHRVSIYGQSGGYDTLTPLGGSSATWLSYSNDDFGLTFRFGPADFTQVNLAMNRKLVRAALMALNAPAGARVLDMFCGIGNFSLPLAASGLMVTGLEAGEEVVARARYNAELNGLSRRCEFAVQDLYDADCLMPGGGASYMLIDPPRSGAGPNLALWVRDTTLRRIVYVSCSPASFASDAAVLERQGYLLSEVGIFDMFPHTAHVETLGVFDKPW